MVDGISAGDWGGKKKSAVIPNRLYIVNIYSTDDRVKLDFLFNFATHNIRRSSAA
jgi:hypothetical protein